MKRTSLPNAIFLIILLSGCSTTYHYTEFLKPSKRYIPSSIYVIGVAERAVTPKMTCPVYTEGIPYGELANIPEKAASLTVGNLQKLSEDMGRYKFVSIAIDDSSVNEDEFATRPFSESEIDSIAGLYDLDGILSLDGQEMLVRTSGSVNVVSVNDDTGMPVQVPEFSKESEVNLTLLWRFYDSSTGQLIDEFQESYERFFGRVSYSEEEIQEFKDEDMGLLDVAGMAAYDYYERISPHWEPDYRQYFISGSPELVSVAQSLQYTGDWERAAVRWKELAESDNSKERHRAAYNMALASEILGQPKLAVEWITKAKLINPTKRTLKYAETLERQVLIYEVVNSQLGIQ